MLLYHAVGSGPTATNVEQFRSQMHWLAGVASIVPIDALLNGATCTGPAVAITFDDGYSGVYEGALPVLASMGLPATVYVNTGWIARGRGAAGAPRDGASPG